LTEQKYNNIRRLEEPTANPPIIIKQEKPAVI